MLGLFFAMIKIDEFNIIYKISSRFEERGIYKDFVLKKTYINAFRYWGDLFI